MLCGLFGSKSTASGYERVEKRSKSRHPTASPATDASTLPLTTDYPSTPPTLSIPSSPRITPAASGADATPAVVFFGSTGVGKSSVINMLQNTPDRPGDIADVASSAGGVTKTVKEFTKTIKGKTYQVFDTAGLGEGPNGTVPSDRAIQVFYDLLTKHPTGVNLIVLVIRGGRLSTAEQNNYDLIRLLCGPDLPVALVVTHLEQEQDAERWWERQPKAIHDRYKFAGHAGVVAAEGLNGMLRESYIGSKPRLEELISSKVNDRPLKVSVNNIVDQLIVDVRAIISRSEEEFHRQLEELLQKYSLTKKQARWFSRKVKQPIIRSSKEKLKPLPKAKTSSKDSKN